MSAMDLNKVKSDAAAILGKGAKIPEPKANINKLITDYQNDGKAYHAALTTLQSKILSLQNGASAIRNGLKQYQDQLDASTFGLDEDEDGVSDKIAKAQKSADTTLDGYISTFDTFIKNLDELDKHTMALAKYKSP